MPRQASNDDGPKDVSLDARVYRIFKISFCTLVQCHLTKRPHQSSTVVSLALNGSMWRLSSNSTSSLLAGITANLGRKPFAWAENGLRGVCRQTTRVLIPCGAPG